MKSTRLLFLSLPLASILALSAVAADLRALSAQAGRPSADQGRRAGQSASPSAGASSRARPVAPERLRAQLTEQQRSRYQACGQTLEKLRNRGHDLALATAAPVINPEAVRSNREQIREQLAVLEEHRSQLHADLNSQQQSAASVRMQQLTRLHLRIQNHLGAIDRALDSPQLDTHRLTEEARLTERAMRAYQLHFRELGDELGMEP